LIFFLKKKKKKLDRSPIFEEIFLSYEGTLSDMAFDSFLIIEKKNGFLIQKKRKKNHELL